jgi:hypothetical protein
VFPGAIAVVYDHRQTLAIGRVQVDGDAIAHPEDARAGEPVGISQRALFAGMIPLGLVAKIPGTD